jgi:hypothetical protein
MPWCDQVIPVTGLDMVKQLCSSLDAFLTPEVRRDRSTSVSLS